MVGNEISLEARSKLGEKVGLLNTAVAVNDRVGTLNRKAID